MIPLVGRPHADQLRGILDRQRIEKHGVDQREDIHMVDWLTRFVKTMPTLDRSPDDEDDEEQEPHVPPTPPDDPAPPPVQDPPAEPEQKRPYIVRRRLAPRSHEPLFMESGLLVAAWRTKAARVAREVNTEG